MYDAVHIVIPHVRLDAESIFDENEVRFCDKKRERWQAKWKSLFLNQADDRLKISGSLPKHVNGHNLYPLGQDGLLSALSVISKHLGPEVLSGRVTRLELATTIEVSRHPAVYLDRLRSTSRLRRTQYDPNGQTVYFENTLRKLTFYDKEREMRKKHVRIPAPWKGLHLMRIELCLKRDIAAQLKLPGPLRFGDLMRPDVLLRSADLWCSQALTIRVNPATATLELPDRAFVGGGRHLMYELASVLPHK